MAAEPGASGAMLEARARLLTAIRGFLGDAGVMEVQTPVLGATAAPDLHLDSLVVTASGRARYLQTSPEYFLKRLLAAGAGPIYQLGPVFRGGESGSRHNVEFTMLEWYRPGVSLEALAGEFEALVAASIGAMARPDAGPEPVPMARLRYADLFQQRFGRNPHTATGDELASLAGTHFPDATAHIEVFGDEGSRNDWLDVLFSGGIEPTLVSPTLVFDYPATQAALARIEPDADGNPVARRFECYLGGVEIANAYDELIDANELRLRFERWNALRRVRGKPAIALDEALLAAVGRMPATTGIAVGIDRLLAWLTCAGSLDEVLAFSERRL